jgi:hypothetical protein
LLECRKLISGHCSTIFALVVSDLDGVSKLLSPLQRVQIVYRNAQYRGDDPSPYLSTMSSLSLFICNTPTHNHAIASCFIQKPMVLGMLSSSQPTYRVCFHRCDRLQVFCHPRCPPHLRTCDLHVRWSCHPFLIRSRYHSKIDLPCLSLLFACSFSFFLWLTRPVSCE